MTKRSVPGGLGVVLSGTITLDNKGKSSGPVRIPNVGSYSAVPATAQTVTVSGCSITVSYAGGIQLKTPTVTSGGQYLAAPTATISGISPPVAPSATQPTGNGPWTSVGGPNFQQFS